MGLGKGRRSLALGKWLRPCARCRHREVAAPTGCGVSLRWKARRERRAHVEVSPVTSPSARTICRTARRSAPSSALGPGGAPLARRNVRDNLGTSQASEGSDIVRQVAPSSCEESVTRRQAVDTAPATQGADGDTARFELQLGSTDGPTGTPDEVDRARYRSHSSFVDGRDKHLDVDPC